MLHFPIIYFFLLTSIYPSFLYPPLSSFIIHTHLPVCLSLGLSLSGVFGDLLGCSLTSSLIGSKLFQLGLTPSVCVPLWHGNHTDPRYEFGGNSTLVLCHEASFQGLCQDVRARIGVCIPGRAVQYFCSSNLMSL